MKYSCGPLVSALAWGTEDVGPEFGAGDGAGGGALDGDGAGEGDSSTPPVANCHWANS